MELVDRCNGYGVAYLRGNTECEKCNFSRKCKSKTNKWISEMKEEIVKKILKELKEIDDKEELEEFVEEHDLEDYVEFEKKDSVAKMKKKIKEALQEKEDDGGDGDGDDGDDGDGDDGDGDDGDGDDDDGDGDGNDLEEIESRVLDLESRVAALEELVKKKKKDSRKMSSDDKDAIKEKLLKKAPYSKKALADLGGRDVKFLASAMGIKAFGSTRDKVEKLILKSKKNK